MLNQRVPFEVKRTFVVVDEQPERTDNFFPRLFSDPVTYRQHFDHARMDRQPNMENALKASLDEPQGIYQDDDYHASLGSEMHTAFPGSGAIGDAVPGIGADLPSEWRGMTSVMVRNLSYKCTPKRFNDELCKAGFEGLFDYTYVPVNYSSYTCKGYAFVNFVDAHTAYRFYTVFDSQKMRIPGSKKLLEVTPSNLQGYNQNITHAERTKHTAKSPSSAQGKNLPQDANQLVCWEQQATPRSSEQYRLLNVPSNMMKQTSRSSRGTERLPSNAMNPTPDFPRDMERLPVSVSSNMMKQTSDSSRSMERFPAAVQPNIAKQASDSSQDLERLPGAQRPSAEPTPAFCYQCGKSRLPCFSFCEWCAARF
eukprot:TRINITY_DN10574_c0_g2_i1.p1 TRINITY_DN10574_c0_g2~~TRINITY_DN10574_c0_g2_i1.p1  ORF type:complete len:367 (-),score=32.89 TRINITY_DN10574_c0_g2_i1:81-1181(-)